MNGKDIQVAAGLWGTAKRGYDAKRTEEARLHYERTRLRVALETALKAGITQNAIKVLARDIASGV